MDLHASRPCDIKQIDILVHAPLPILLALDLLSAHCHCFRNEYPLCSLCLIYYIKAFHYYQCIALLPPTVYFDAYVNVVCLCKIDIFYLPKPPSSAFQSCGLFQSPASVSPILVTI